MADTGKTAAKVAGDIRQLLGEIVRNHPAQKGVVRRIEEHLDDLVRLAGHRRPVRPRRGKDINYVVEVVNQRPMLAERRSSGQPLRVDQDFYRGVVSVLASAKKPLTFDDIMEGVAPQMVQRPADWQLRVVLRFLRRHSPPILGRERGRYTAEDSKTFLTAAAKAWKAAIKT